MAQCKSCNASIVWVTLRSRETGADTRMPIDPDPSEKGNVALGFHPIAMVLTKAEIAEYDKPLYVSHFATCPNAAQHRKTDDEPVERLPYKD